ncbi:alpha/beta hydrolase [Loktanella sp. D2R18]|uniref:alpha/beta fold hydrolase n=1 Tax=Rhodobacterales TaxID=204455 RepID=UPI000DEB314C|nr:MULTISPECIES: alpha/beta hydrolase [Rhodobacterales]MDO6589144.1 alpha/beta hydrolase [Yoonia sp. 1_MG-2023]RBW45424.1 alpha/beta hydrolase [Loktanella sp. D2R18]
MTLQTYPTDFPTPTQIHVNGVELEVFEAGRENAGNPILLCHGWPEHAYSWRYQIPALVAAGYHVIAPNQRGYGNSSCPDAVETYDITQLAGDLIGLLDYFGYENAIFAGHDWGASVVWGLALLHPARVSRIINLALPYQARTPMPWIDFMEEFFGGDHYFVHFNRQPGVADAILDANRTQFLRNLFRKNLPQAAPEPGMMMINLAQAETALGDPLMGSDDLEVYINAFQQSGFTSSINWYRNLDRNWHLLADVPPVIKVPTLMIHGDRDLIPQSENLSEFVPNVDVVSFDCGHCIQQEKPSETNAAILDWLAKS